MQLQRKVAEAHAVALTLSNARIGERQEIVRLAKERQKVAKDHVEEMQAGALDGPLKEMLDGMTQRLTKAVKETGLTMADEKTLIAQLGSESSTLFSSVSTVWGNLAGGIVKKLGSRPLDLDPIDFGLHTRIQASLAEAEAAVTKNDETAAKNAAVAAGDRGGDKGGGGSGGGGSSSASGLSSVLGSAKFGGTMPLKNKEIELESTASGLAAIETLVRSSSQPSPPPHTLRLRCWRCSHMHHSAALSLLTWCPSPLITTSVCSSRRVRWETRRPAYASAQPPWRRCDGWRLSSTCRAGVQRSTRSGLRGRSVRSSD